MKALLITMIIVISTTANYAAQLETNNRLVITKSENDFFCLHLKMILKECPSLIKEGELSEKNIIYTTLKKYSLDLSECQNDVQFFIKKHQFEYCLNKYLNNKTYIDNEVNKSLAAQVKKEELDWERAYDTLKNNRYIGTGIILKQLYPKYDYGFIGIGKNAGIAFLKDNDSLQADEAFPKEYFAAFIYKFIFAGRKE